MTCGKPFEHEESLLSLVRVVEGGLAREDYCGACRAKADRADAYSVWTAEYYDPKVAEQEPPEVFSPLRQLFYEAVASEERLELAKAFLAGQLLRRQKVFRTVKESDEADGQAKTLLYSDRIGNRLIEVIDPSFTYAELETARVALLERLRELEAPPQAEEAPVDGGGTEPRPENQEEPDGAGLESGDEVTGVEATPVDDRDVRPVEEGSASDDDSGTQETSG